MSTSSKDRAIRHARAVTFTVLGVLLGGAAVSIALTPAAPRDGADFWGEPVYIEHQAATVPMDIRIGCRISAFGVAPWLAPGRPKDLLWEIDTRRALRAMGVPDAATDIAIERMRAGKPDDVAGFGDDDGLAGGGQAYEPRFSTTYRSGDRRVVCHDSGTRFGNDRREYATVYVIKHQGAAYHLAEFLACGNVSRLFPAAPGARQAFDAPGAQPHSKPAAPGRLIVNKVPEPGVLALSALALVGAVIARKS